LINANIRADEFVLEPGFVRLDNGTDMKGWTEDEGWTVIDGAIHSDIAKAKGSIYHEKTHSPDCIIRLQFRAPAKGDSGLYVYGKQYQVRDFPKTGPAQYGKFAKPAGEWNQLELDFTNGIAVVKLNGEVIERVWKIGIDPKKGLGLQKEVGNFDFRYIVIKE